MILLGAVRDGVANISRSSGSCNLIAIGVAPCNMSARAKVEFGTGRNDSKGSCCHSFRGNCRLRFLDNTKTIATEEGVALA